MKKGGLVKDKSYEFALKIVALARTLQSSAKEYELARQLLRSGTSIGANIEEAAAAQSRKDFVSKMAIASKEARETKYWLRLIKDSGLFSPLVLLPLLEACEELIRMLTAIVKSSQKASDE